MNPGWLRMALFVCCNGLLLQSCDRFKDDDEMPEGRYGYSGGLYGTVVIDSTQDRLDSNANLSTTPVGHGSLSPRFNFLRIQQIELLEDSLSPNGAPIFEQEKDFTGSSTPFYGSFHYSGQTVGFSYLRIYFSYQNNVVGCKINGDYMNVNVLSFLQHYYDPFNSIYVNDSLVNKDSVKNQGEWFLEVDSPGVGAVLHGQTSTITEPNCLHYSLPVQTDQKYVLTCPINPPISFTKGQGHSITISISSNHCFEWVEHSDPAYFEPLNGDTIFDIGLRGAKVIQ